MRKFTLLALIAIFSQVAFAQDSSYPKGKISGIIFGDYYYSLERDSSFSDLSNTAINGIDGIHGMQIRRIYLGYDYKLNEKFSTRVRLESDGANFTVKSSNKYNKFGLFIKDAYIKWRVFDNHDLIIGIQGPPSFSISESYWGNRFLEKTIMDLRKIASSRDMGISIKGKLNPSGSLKYWLMYGNNLATKPEMDNYRRFYGHLQYSPVENMTITAYSDYQTSADIVNTYDSTMMLSNNVLTTALFVAYKIKGKYTLGLETYMNQADNAFDDGSGLVKSSGYGVSVFGAYTFNPKWEAIARFDHFEPNSHDMANGDSRNWIITGIKYMPASNVVFSPNVLVETYENSGSTEYKSSIVPRLTFSFKF